MFNNIPVWGEFDVVVLGGGPAGYSAALGAAQAGSRTLLVEQHGFLGGMATAALVMPWNVWAKPVTSNDIGGAYEKLVQTLEKENSTYLFSDKTVLRSFDPSSVKIKMDQILQESGVKLLFHTLAVDVLKEGELISGVVLQNKTGRGIVKAKAFVDTTGDGDVAVRAGAEYSVGKDNKSMQPGTLIFKMGNVDVAELTDYLQANREEIGQWPPTDDIRFGDGNHICISGLFKLVSKAKEEGVPLISNSLIITSTPTPGLVTVNVSKVYGIDLDDPFSLSDAEIEARKQVYYAQAFMKKYIPGFSNAYFADIAVQIGIRETRRITGDTIVSFEDIKVGRHYPDRVVRLFNVGHLDFTKTDEAGNRVATFEYLPKDLEINFSSLLVKGIENLVTGGRCISTDADVFGFIRTQTACFPSGQAAGVIASVGSRWNGQIRSCEVGQVQEILTSQGIKL